MNTSPAVLLAGFLCLSWAAPAFGRNIAFDGSGIMGSNDASIDDLGSSHFQQGTLFNIRDTSEETRVDSWLANPTPANTNGYAGVRWSTARFDPVTSLKVTLATFINGGWFGNRECPELGQTLTRSMLVAPVVQVSTSRTLAEWVTVPSSTDYLSRLEGHAIAADSFPTRRSFTITLAEAQRGIYGIRVIGPTGGFNPGTGFLGIFEIAVEATYVEGDDYDGDDMTDTWEGVHGFDPTVKDADLDPDTDGLTNLQEYHWNTNPRLADTDGDGLNDLAETTVHRTFPANADTDNDLIGDGAELLSLGSDPLRADTDGDGLTDGAEATVHLTSPMVRDQDGDGFPDGREIALGTSPTSAASRPVNIALAAAALLGRNAGTSPAQLAVTGTPRANAGQTARIHDGLPLTLAHTRETTGTASHTGLLWDVPWPQPVARLEVTLATHSDGGWFGTSTPVAGAPLTASHLTEPALQTTVDGTTWVTLDPSQYTSTYLARLTGHRIGGGGQPAATRRAVTFTLSPPIAGLRGLRLAGPHRTYLAVAEISATDASTPDDVDGDGLATTEETARGTDPGLIDSDEDGLTDRAEVVTHGTNPIVGDTDGDGFTDGQEVVDGTNPLSATHTGNLARFATGLIGINNAIDGDAGQTVINSGTPANISDGNLATRVDSWNGTQSWRYSFVGLRWTTPRALNVLRVHFATFNNGGWFGPTNQGPVPGEPLLSSHLVEPTLQVSTNGGVSWSTVPHTSNYLEVMPGHRIGETTVLWSTRSPAVTFTLAKPSFGINAVRLIGLEGGSHESFVGVFDVAAFLAAEGPDIDADGLPDAWETSSFGGLAGQQATDDTDGDGSVELIEYAFGMNPRAFDVPPSGSVEDGHLTLTLAKQPGVTYQAQAGSSLSAWSSDGLEVLVDDATTLRVRDSIPIGSGPPQRFLRVRVTAAP